MEHRGQVALVIGEAPAEELKGDQAHGVQVRGPAVGRSLKDLRGQVGHRAGHGLGHVFHGPAGDDRQAKVQQLETPV